MTFTHVESLPLPRLISDIPKQVKFVQLDDIPNRCAGKLLLEIERIGSKDYDISSKQNLLDMEEIINLLPWRITNPKLQSLKILPLM